MPAIAVNEIQNNGVKQIAELMQTFSPAQQKKIQQKIVEELNYLLLMKEAKRLDNSVIENNITMEEIVAETKAARKENDKKNAGK
jgi:hypothetical protein